MVELYNVASYLRSSSHVNTGIVVLLLCHIERLRWNKILLLIFINSFVLFIIKNIWVLFYQFGAEFDQLMRKIWKHQINLTALASRSTAQPVREACYETFCLYLRIRDPPILHGWLAAESLSATGTVLLSVCLLLCGSATHHQAERKVPAEYWKSG